MFRYDSLSICLSGSCQPVCCESFRRSGRHLRGTKFQYAAHKRDTDSPWNFWSKTWCKIINSKGNKNGSQCSLLKKKQVAVIFCISNLGSQTAEIQSSGKREQLIWWLFSNPENLLGVDLRSEHCYLRLIKQLQIIKPNTNTHNGKWTVFHLSFKDSHTLWAPLHKSQKRAF